MYLQSFLQANNFNRMEGFSQQVTGQIRDLIRLTETPVTSVLEIGFNGGHSSEIFLENNDALTVTSFDLGEYECVVPAQAFLAGKYPSRHQLILGDSTVTVPRFSEENPGKAFDILFIDGGHEYSIAKADLENCRKLAHSNTLVLLDDTIYRDDWKVHYTLGPTRAWLEAIADGKVVELGRREYEPGRGMSWGKYVL
jgi:predicted O-methyltransferase YrrM